MTKSLAVLACSSLLASVPAIPAHAQPAPSSAQDHLNRAADAVLALKSTQFTLRRQGAPAVLDEAAGLTFTAADCSYAAPDRVSCGVRVSLRNGSVLQITRVWVPEGVFQNNPLTKQFARLPADDSFNGVALFARTGIPEILRTGVQTPRIANKGEQVNRRTTVHLAGEVRGDRLGALIGPTLDPGVTYPVDLWIDDASFMPVRLHITEPGDNAWLIELFAINDPVNIPTPQVPAPTAPPGH